MADITRIERSKGPTFRIRVANGYDNNGKQIRKSKTWTPDNGMTEKQIQKELNRIAVEFERQVIDGLNFDNVKFANFSEIWVKDYLEKKCSLKYITESKRMLKAVNDEIGHIPLPRLKKAHLQEFYNKLENDTRTVSRETRDSNGNKVIETIEKHKSPNTIRHYHRLISTILTKAAQWDYIDLNICLGKGIELPKQKKYEPCSLEDYEAERLLECLQQESIENKAPILIMLCTGIRNGEAMGLEWNDIDFDNKLISINRSSQYIEGIGVFTKETKNNSSERVLPAMPDLLEFLLHYKAWQSVNRLRQGSGWKSNPLNTNEKYCDNWNTCKKNGNSIYCARMCNNFKDVDRLFTQYNGVPMHPKTPYQFFKKFLKKNSLPECNIHSLRHTYITIMLDAGTPLATVAKLAGHSSTATTSAIYSHSIKRSEQMAVEKVANALNIKKYKDI